eukprot:m.56271 g.56271  ORF g.56271 m.56271 type:complete len:83 (-) comp15576_c0_seq3:250-498(-)
MGLKEGMLTILHMSTLFNTLTQCMFFSVGPIACHAFSNLMGFPDFGSIAGHHREVALKITYSLGLIGFLGLLRPFSTLFLSS